MPREDLAREEIGVNYHENVETVQRDFSGFGVGPVRRTRASDHNSQ
jgi:hypothetical protein